MVIYLTASFRQPYLPPGGGPQTRPTKYGGDCSLAKPAAVKALELSADALTTAQPVPKCPKCRAEGYVTKDTAWGIASDCLACGHHEYFSIGD